MPLQRRQIIWIGAGIVLVAAGSLALMDRAPEIEAIQPRRGPIRQSFREPARTRLEDTWKIALQVSGRIGRIDFEPGDRVSKGQDLVAFDREPLEAAVREAEAVVAALDSLLAVKDDDTLELTELAEAEAMAHNGEQSLAAARARVQEAEQRLSYADKELDRARRLVQDGTLPPNRLDDARLEAETARLSLDRTQAEERAQHALLEANRLAIRRVRETIARKRLERSELLARLDQARAQLARARHDLDLAVVVSPIDGVVLERYERGERPLPEGAELMLLGDPAQLEVIADILTEDALRLAAGGEVELESPAGGLRLSGRVKRIEPQGFTKLSSLGVEEQRVNAIVELEEVPETLGIGYRLHARFITGRKKDALIVPRFSVLQDPQGGFYVLAIEGGKLRPCPVRLGLRSDLEFEVLEGLDPETTLVRAPEATMNAGRAVRPRLVQ